jgi:hypothetical protein
MEFTQQECVMKPIASQRGKTESKAKPDGVTPLKPHVERALDEALDESFPASDPVSVTVAKPQNKVKPRSKPIRKRRATQDYGKH